MAEERPTSSVSLGRHILRLRLRRLRLLARLLHGDREHQTGWVTILVGGRVGHLVDALLRRGAAQHTRVDRQARHIRVQRVGQRAVAATRFRQVL